MRGQCCDKVSRIVEEPAHNGASGPVLPLLRFSPGELPHWESWSSLLVLHSYHKHIVCTASLNRRVSAGGQPLRGKKGGRPLP